MESVGWADLNISNSCDCHLGEVRVGSRGGRSYCFQGSFGYSGLNFSFFTTNVSFRYTAGNENFVLVVDPLHDCRCSEMALSDAFEVAKVTERLLGLLRCHIHESGVYSANHDARAALTGLECGACTDWTE